jgi:hypothetical protein
MATFSAHTASPPPPSRTPAGSQTMEYDYVYVSLLFAFEPTLRVSQCASGCEKQEGEALNCKRFGKEKYRDHCA